MPTNLAIAADPTIQAPDATDATELAFYHDYVDHYRIAEHYFHGNLLPDERNDFQIHLSGCAECADRVLLAELFDQGSSAAPHQRAANVGKPASNRKGPERLESPGPSESEDKPRTRRGLRLPSEAPTAGLPPVPTPSDSAALQSLLASIALPTNSRGTTGRRSYRDAESRPSPEADRPSSLRLVPREEPGAERRVAPIEPVPQPSPASFPVLEPAKICGYLTEQPGRTTGGSARFTCNLPMRARWVASFTPLELALILGLAALFLLAIPSAVFLLQ